MALEAGSVFVRLLGLFQGQEFDKWDRAVDQARTKSRDPITEKLDLDIGPFQRKLAEAVTEEKAALREVNALGQARFRDPVSGRFAAAPTTTRLAPEPVATAVNQPSFAGVRGSKDIGSVNNPMVFTMEAGRLTPLGSRAAAAGYAGQYDIPQGALAPQVGSSSSSQPPPARTGSGRSMQEEPLTRGMLGPVPGEDIKVGVDQNTLDRSLASVRSKVSGAARGKHNIDVGVNQSALDRSLTAMRAKVSSVVNSIKKTVDIRVDADVSPAERQLAGLRSVIDSTKAEAASVGGDGGDIGGGPPTGGPPDGGDGGDGGDGFGRRAGRGIGSLLALGLGGGGRARGRFGLGAYNPFRFGIHGPFGVIGGSLGLGVEHLVGTAGAVAGSAVGALGGAGALAAGAAGQIAVGGGADLAVMKSTIADTKTLSKGYEALSMAVTKYGANSTQAATAQRNLNAQIVSLGGASAVGVKAEMQLAQNVAALNVQWDKATQQARVSATNILEQVVKLGKDYVPRVADAAKQNLDIINEHIKPLFTWLEGPTGIGIWNHLEDNFKKNLPTAVDAFVNTIKALLRTISQASDFTGGFTRKWDELAKRWQNMSDAQLHNTIQKLYNDFYLWEQVVKNLAIDLFRLFKAGSGEGNQLVSMLNNLLIKWGEWEKSARGQTALKTFFANRKAELLALLQVLGPVLKMFGELWAALQPLVPAVTAILTGVASAFKDVEPLVHAFATGLSAVLKVLMHILNVMGPFKDVVLVPLGAFLVVGKITSWSNAWRLAGNTIGGVINAVKGLVGWLGKLGDAEAASAVKAGEAEVAQGGLATEEKAVGASAAAATPEVAALDTAEAAGLGGAGAAGAGAAARGAGVGLATTGGAALALGGGYLGARGALAVSRGLGISPPPVRPQGFSGPNNLASFLGAAGGTHHQTGLFGTGIGPNFDPLNVIGLGSKQTGAGIPNMNKQLSDLAEHLNKIKNPAKLSADQINKLQQQATKLAATTPKAASQLNALWQALQRLKFPKLNIDTWNHAFNQAWTAVHKFIVGGSGGIKDLKDRFDTNMRLIAHTVGLNSDAGQKLASANFNKLVTHVEGAMRKGTISVKDGMNLIRTTAAHGTQSMQNDLSTRYADIVQTIYQAWKSGKIDTQTALQQLRTINKDENTKLRNDVKDHYDHLLQDAKDMHDEGLLTDRQYADKRKQIHHDMAKAILDAQVKLTQGNARIMDGMNAATNKGMDSLFKELNKALKALNVNSVAWSVGQAVQSAASATQGVVQGVAHIFGKERGGTLPGAEYGLEDNMILVDPTGKPRARMAGNEGVLTRWQMPEVDHALAVTKAIGMGNYGSLNELWGRVTRPHGYARGGKLPGYAGGGVVTASQYGGPGDPGTGSTGYRGDNLYQHPDSYAELDMGHALGGLPYMAALDISYKGRTARAYKRDIGAGGPGMGGHPRAIDLWFQLANAIGFSGLDLVTINGGSGVNVSISGAGANVAPTLKSPKIKGPGGPLQKAAQSVMDKATNAANQYLQSHTPATVGGAGFSGHPFAHGKYTFPLPQGSWSPGQVDQGWDLSAPGHTPLYALGNGVIAGHGISGFGPWAPILRLDDGNQVYYGHAGPGNQLPIGTRVSAGEVIGEVGAGIVGISTGPHLEIGFYPPGGSGAGGAMKSALGYQRGGRLGAALSRYARGGRLGSALSAIGNLPMFRRGGRTVNISGRNYHLYTPTKPPPKPKAKKPKNVRPKPLDPLTKFVQSVPGTAQFSADDAEIAKLEDLYSRQSNIYNLYDAGGGTLPEADLDVLAGIKIKEWNILNKEYKEIPGILHKLQHKLYGHQVGHGRHRHYTGGVYPEIGHLTGLINQDEALVTRLNDQLYQDQQAAAVAKHGITQQALNAAEGLAAQLGPYYDAIQNNVDQAISISNQIKNLPGPIDLNPLMGSAYGDAQQANRTLTKRRNVLGAKRSIILERNSGLRAQLGKILQQKQLLAAKYRIQGFDVAWQYQQERYKIGFRIRKLKESLKKLKQHLEDEKKIGSDYSGAIQSLETRMHGGDANDPSATGIQQEMGDIGYDILSLNQTGAEVPENLLTEIGALLGKLGVQLPAGYATPGGSVSLARSLAEFMSFQVSRQNIFSQFGSNFAAAGTNPFASPAGLAAGTQYYGAASGPFSGVLGPGPQAAGMASLPGGKGGTTITINQNFAAGPPDPHTFAAGLSYELGAQM